MTHDAFGARLAVGTTVLYAPGGLSCAPVKAEVTDFRGPQVRVVVTGLPRTGAPSKAVRLGASLWLAPEDLAVLEVPARLHITDHQRHGIALGGYPAGNHS